MPKTGVEQTKEERDKEIEEEKRTLVEIFKEERLRRREENRSERLGIDPGSRIVIAAGSAGIYGFVTGFFSGASLSGLRYLAENAHRLPKTKGGWYFYHKRRNYVLAKDGMFSALKKMTKLGTVASLYFGIEAYIDHLRGTIDFASTAVTSLVVGTGYGLSLGLGRRQALKTARTFVYFGLATGLIQDGMRYARGNDVWYMPKRRVSDSASTVRPL